ncbi:MAG: hypothetical protein GF320_05200 [Armatimonadia bacterium]|nr:hypothetical protein [Armatimonadia bacterium]
MRNMALSALALAASLISGALAQDQQVQLRYAPPTGGEARYDCALEGSIDVGMMEMGNLPLLGDLGFSVQYGDREDGILTETLTYNAVELMVATFRVNSNYIDIPVVTKRGPEGRWLFGGEALPPPGVMSADLLVLMGQVPRMLMLPEEPVGIGEEWGSERIMLPRYFEVGELPDFTAEPPEPGGALGDEGGPAEDPGGPAEDPGGPAEDPGGPAEDPGGPAEDEGAAAEGQAPDGEAPAEGAEAEAAEEADAEPGETSNTYLSQRSRLQGIQEYQGRPAAIIVSEMLVEFDQEIIFAGLPVDGRLMANMEQAIYVDTGEMIQANVELAAEFSIPDPRSGEAVTMTLNRVLARYGPEGQVQPAIPPEQGRQPPGGGRGRGGAGGGRAGVR